MEYLPFRLKHTGFVVGWQANFKEFLGICYKRNEILTYFPKNSPKIAAVYGCGGVVCAIDFLSVDSFGF